MEVETLSGTTSDDLKAAIKELTADVKAVTKYNETLGVNQCRFLQITQWPPKSPPTLLMTPWVCNSARSRFIVFSLTLNFSESISMVILGLVAIKPMIPCLRLFFFSLTLVDSFITMEKSSSSPSLSGTFLLCLGLFDGLSGSFSLCLGHFEGLSRTFLPCLGHFLLHPYT